VLSLGVLLLAVLLQYVVKYGFIAKAAKLAKRSSENSGKLGFSPAMTVQSKGF